MPRVPTGRDGGELVERVVEINRVAKVVKGGRRFSFTALVVVGDEVDQVGIGYGKAREVPVAIQKAVEDAKKNMFKVPKHQNTITHEVLGVFGAGRVMLKPASAGTGVIAGAGVRAVLELAGIKDVLSKSLGTSNPINLCRAAETALRSLRRPEDVAKLRGKRVRDILPAAASADARAAAAEGRGRDAAAAEGRPSPSRWRDGAEGDAGALLDPGPAGAPRYAAGARPRPHRQEPRAPRLALAAGTAAPGRLPRPGRGGR